MTPRRGGRKNSLALLLVGCVSGAGEFQWCNHERYTQSQKNRPGLMNEVYPRETV